MTSPNNSNDRLSIQNAEQSTAPALTKNGSRKPSLMDALESQVDSATSGDDKNAFRSASEVGPMRGRKLVDLLPTTSHSSPAEAFKDYQRAVCDYNTLVTAFFKAGPRENVPDIPPALIVKAMAAGVKLNRFCSAISAPGSTVRGAVKRIGAVLDGTPYRFENTPDSISLPQPDAVAIAGHFQEQDMPIKPDPGDQNKHEKRIRRSSELVKSLIEQTVEDHLAVYGSMPSKAFVAKSVECSGAVLERYWPGPKEDRQRREDDSHVVDRPKTKVMLGNADDDEAAFELTAQRLYNTHLVEGAYQVGEALYKCDCMIPDKDGRLQPHSEAWRLQLGEIRRVISTFREVHG